MEEEKMREVLEERVRLKVSIIGVGNAGNQLLNEAIKHENVSVFAINSSDRDLRNSVTDDSIKSFIVGTEGRGAGKHRDVGVELFKQNGLQLVTAVPAFKQVCETADVIVVACSTAGGTGSSISPNLVGLLKKMYPNKIVIFSGILPRTNACIEEQENSIACLADVMKHDVPYILTDLDYYGDMPNHEAFPKCQSYIMNCIDVITGKYLNMSKYGMIDENDMRMIIGQPGYLSIYNLSGVKQSDLDQRTMQSMMIDLIKNSPAAPIMRDGILKNMGAILNMPDDMTDASMSSNYTELQGYIGRPITTYENYANVATPTGQMIIILSGQTQPINRINQMQDIVNEIKENAKRQKSFDLSELTKDSITGSREIPKFIAGIGNKEEVDADSAAADFFKNL